MIRFSKIWIIVLILAIFLPFWVVWNTTQAWDVVLIYPILTSFFSALWIAWIAASTRFSYMRLFFWVYVYIMFGIAAIAQVSLNNWPWPGYYTTTQISVAYFIIWLGLFAYEIGYYIKNRNNELIRNINQIKYIPLLKYQGFPGISLAGLSVFLAIITYIYLNALEIDFFTMRNDYSAQLLDTFGTIGYAVILLFTQFLPLTTLLWIITEYQTNNSTRQGSKLLYLLTGIAILSILIISSNPIIAPRWWFSSIFISLFLISWGKSKKTLFLLGLGIPIAYTLLFPYMDLFRTQDTLARTLSEARSDFVGNLVEGDFDSLQQIMNTQVFVDYQGITYGRQLLGVVAYWIPRGVWENKPLDTGVMVAEYLGYSFTNLSSPLWAEGLINFGLFGVSMFLGIWGYISNLLDRVFQSYCFRNLKYPVWILPSFYLLVPAQNLLIRGSLLVATLYISSPVIVIFIWSWLERIRIAIFLSKNPHSTIQNKSLLSK